MTVNCASKDIHSDIVIWQGYVLLLKTRTETTLRGLTNNCVEKSAFRNVR